jgi:hypothetical protein
MERLGDARKRLWQNLIKIDEATGHGFSKAVSKLYASWLRTARLKQDATLEMDEDDSSIIEWGGFRINLPQLKNWVIHRIGKLPREHRVALIRACEQYLTFNDLQAAELCRQLFQDSHSARSFMKMFRKTLTQGVMGWKPLIMDSRAAADRWSAEEIQRLLKEFFDPIEYAYLWLRLSKFTDTQEQLESRLRAQEEGLRIPRGSNKKYVKWLKNTEDAEEHARMMILLQRTQELDLIEWRSIREEAYERFGKAKYKELLRRRADLTPETPKGSIPRFERKKVMFGAMKEEKDGLTLEWERRLPAIYDALSSGQNESTVLSELVLLSKEEKKMKCIRKAIQNSEAEWDEMTEQMCNGSGLVSYLDHWNLPEEIQAHCYQIVKDVCTPMEEKMQEEPIQTGMKLLTELLSVTPLVANVSAISLWINPECALTQKNSTRR